MRGNGTLVLYSASHRLLIGLTMAGAFIFFSIGLFSLSSQDPEFGVITASGAMLILLWRWWRVRIEVDPDRLRIVGVFRTVSLVRESVTAVSVARARWSRGETIWLDTEHGRISARAFYIPYRGRDSSAHREMGYAVAILRDWVPDGSSSSSN